MLPHYQKDRLPAQLFNLTDSERYFGVASLFYEFHLLLLLLLSSLIIRMICMKNRWLWLMVFLCSFFLSLRTYYYVNKIENEPQRITNGYLKIRNGFDKG